ncbi:DUF6089 family protein [Chryseolinea lacunae]|uniref:DUF6089 domain-containing protein n=1 Tax=Chryseolinea lacunae TaxID=2801331 RepID=A0ABS1KRH3_9BACT|nr:DUF6089 family protein [Chryseolinea lacunae]MBL0741793.1 hypothetical protein [Chryseolinea lacunae]
MRKLIYLATAVFMLSFAYDASAQMNRRSIKKNNKRISSFRGRKSWFGKEKVYNSIGISVNALNYYGDLAPRPSSFSTDISFTRPALGITFSHRFGPRYTLTAGFMYGTLKGSDAKSADEGDSENGVFRYRRNLSFRNRIKELSVVASFDLFPNSATYISRVKWTPYAFLGAAVFLHNPQAQAPATDPQGNPLPEAGKWVNLQPLGTEGQYAQLQEGDVNNGIKPYKLVQIAIPFGLGARFRLNEVMDLSGELGFRYTFTDYLDDVSQNYVDLGVFGNNQLAKAMSDRASEISTPNTTYVGRDGGTYNVVAGYGSEFRDNVRGNKNNRDIYMVTTIRLSYILGKNFHRAKFR